MKRAHESIKAQKITKISKRNSDNHGYVFTDYFLMDIFKRLGHLEWIKLRSVCKRFKILLDEPTLWRWFVSKTVGEQFLYQFNSEIETFSNLALGTFRFILDQELVMQLNYMTGLPLSNGIDELSKNDGNYQIIAPESAPMLYILREFCNCTRCIFEHHGKLDYCKIIPKEILKNKREDRWLVHRVKIVIRYLMECYIPKKEYGFVINKS